MLIGNSCDITEQKSLKNQLAQSQKLEAVGQLAAGITHEINTDGLEKVVLIPFTSFPRKRESG